MEYEPKEIECICSELTISKQKWICYSIYRPPENSNVNLFFEKLSNSLGKANKSYENFIIMGDFNIDIDTSGSEQDKLADFCNLFNLQNLVKSKTCISKTHQSKIDLILTNKYNCFQKTKVINTGLSDYHGFIFTFFRRNYIRLKPKTVHYRNYKYFDDSKFKEELSGIDFELKSDDPNENYDFIINTFSKVVNKHAPLKKKTIRGNQAPFMNKEFRKAIYTRSRLRNKYCRNASKENEILYKRQRNKCVSLRRKSMKNYFRKIGQQGIVTNKKFWNTIKPFLTNKGHISSNDIVLIEKDSIITEEKKLVELFNNHYINIVQNSSGMKPELICQSFPVKARCVEEIISNFQTHPSIQCIRRENTSLDKEPISFALTTAESVAKIVLSLDTKKATGFDMIPTRLVKLGVKTISSPLSNAINNSILERIFPDNAKVAVVSPLDKNTDNKNTILNYRPVSLLSVFSKVYEKVLKES